MKALSLSNISKSFGEVEVLRDIDIEVEDGEFVVLSVLPAAGSRRCCA